MSDPIHDLWIATFKDVVSQLKDEDGLPITVAPEWEPAIYSEAPLAIGMGGEGSGKSYTAALILTAHLVYDRIFYGEKGGLYWIVGADFEDAKREYDITKDFLTQLGTEFTSSQHNARDQQLQIKTVKEKQTIVTMSSYDFTKLGREEPDGIIGAEVSRWYEEAFRRCEGRHYRKFDHGWGFYSGSFETSFGWLPDLFKYGQGPNDRRLRSYSIPFYANRKRYPGGEDDPAVAAAKAANSPQRFLERFMGVPAPPKGIIFSEFRNNLHVDPEITYDPTLPVYVAVDPGGKAGVYCVEFVQFRENSEIWVVEEIYVHAWTHEAVIREVKMRDGWAVGVVGGAIDIASTQGHMGMGIPYEEWYKDTGKVLQTRKMSIEDTIERVRLGLSVNPATGRSRMRIHPSCTGFISEMGGCASPLDGGGPWMRHESKAGLGPPMDRNDHACKAMGYLLGSPLGFRLHRQRDGLEVESVSYMREPTRRGSRRGQGSNSYAGVGY